MPRRKARPSVARAASARSRPAGPPTWIAASIIAIAGIAAYANSFGGVFVFDDRNAIALNPSVRTLWPLTQAMSAPRDTTLAGRPVASVSFALTYAFAPVDARDVFAIRRSDPSSADRLLRNVWTYHAVNLAIHLLAALTLFGVVRRTLRAPALAPRFGDRADALACAIATIWVVHPLTTAAVTYVVQRVESLMALFYLLTLYCAIRGDRPAVSAVGRTPWTIAAVVFCALAMGTKEAAVTAPLMVVAWDALMLDEPWSAIVAKRWRLYVGLASTWIIEGAILATAPRSASVGFGLQGVSAWAYLATQAGVLAHYLRLAVVPRPLAIDYEWPIVSSMRDALIPGLFVVALLAATLWGLVRRAPWAFAGVWFFLILAPTSSVVPIVTEVAADHRMYLPLASTIGLLVLIAYWHALKGVPYIVSALIIVALGSLTYTRNEDYSSQERLYAQTIAARPANARARTNLASVLIEEGRARDAEPLLQEAIRLKPEYADAHANLGVAYVVEGRLEEAIAPLEKAASLAADSPEVWRNYAEALGGVGRSGDAVRAYRKALASTPDDPDVLEGLAWILATSPDASVRDGAAALELSKRAADRSAGDAHVLDTLGAAYAENGQFTEAISAAQRALTIARSAGQSDLVPQIELRLELYSHREPFREPIHRQ